MRKRSLCRRRSNRNRGDADGKKVKSEQRGGGGRELEKGIHSSFFLLSLPLRRRDLPFFPSSSLTLFFAKSRRRELQHNAARRCPERSDDAPVAFFFSHKAFSFAAAVGVSGGIQNIGQHFADVASSPRSLPLFQVSFGLAPPAGALRYDAGGI